jgi:hypothetical protein
MNVLAVEAHRRYVNKERLAAGIFNVIVGVLSTYLAFPNAPVIPLWGQHGIAFDLVPTVFMLTLVGNFVVTVLAHKRLRADEVQIIDDSMCSWIACRLPRNMFIRLLVIAVSMTVLAVPLSVLVLKLVGIDSMSYHQYMGFKACYGPAIGVLSVSVAIETALRDHKRVAR